MAGGSQQEKDQWIEVSFDPSRADTLLIRNGYQASQAAYRGNRRLKDILVSVDGGKAIPVRLKDTTKASRSTWARPGENGPDHDRIHVSGAGDLDPGDPIR